MRKINNGSNIVEYIIPLAVIALVVGSGILYLTTGGNFTNFLTASSDMKLDSAKHVAVIGDKSDDEAPLISTAQFIDEYNVVSNDDGSVSFDAGEQRMTVPENILNLYRTVFMAEETTGVAGTESLVRELAYMVKKNEGNYEGEVPVEIMFGTSDRKAVEGTGWETNYIGTAQVNSATLKVGNEYLILQKDQDCTTKDPAKGCNYAGNYRIEGKVNSGNSFVGEVTRELDKERHNSKALTGDFEANLNSDNGIVFAGDFKTKNHNNVPVKYDWTIDMSDTSLHFDLN